MEGCYVFWLAVFQALLFWQLGACRSKNQASPLLLPLQLYSRDGNVTGGAGISSVMPSKDQSYFSLIVVGNISFHVALDTASADLWLASSACTTFPCRQNPTYPLAYNSPSFVSVNNNSTTFFASYADGTAASGFVARETVQLSDLVVESQAFALVYASNITLTDKTSGILGLGFPRLSEIYRSVVNGTPFFSNLAQEGVLDYPLFGLSLPTNGMGTLALGAIDSSIVKNLSNIVWSAVVPFPPLSSETGPPRYLQWVIPIASISVNGTSINPMPTYPMTEGGLSLALLDIGTVGFYGPYQDVARIFSLIPGGQFVDPKGRWAVPCNTNQTIGFTFGDQTFVLSPAHYLIGPAEGNPNLCLSWPQAHPPSSDGVDWQLGTTFLKTVYSIFSYGIDAKEPPMIGLYPLRNVTNAPSASSSSAMATIATTLPNFLVPTPTYTTPQYIFNTGVEAYLGEVVLSELAVNTYSPLFGTLPPSITSIPTIAPPTSVFTFVTTDLAGDEITSISTAPAVSIVLGRPPNASVRENALGHSAALLCILLLNTLAINFF